MTVQGGTLQEALPSAARDSVEPCFGWRAARVHCLGTIISKTSTLNLIKLLPALRGVDTTCVHTRAKCVTLSLVHAHAPSAVRGQESNACLRREERSDVSLFYTQPRSTERTRNKKLVSE